MTSLMELQPEAKQIFSVSRAATSLQRNCDCGQHTIAGGQCEDCGKKSMMVQRTSQHWAVSGGSYAAAPMNAAALGFVKPRLGHDFSRTPLRNVPAATSAKHKLPLLFDVGEVELGHTDCDWIRQVADDEVFKPNSDKPKVKISSEDKCTSACTVAHENVHVTQLQPICKSYFECYKAAAVAAAKSSDCKDYKGAEHDLCVDIATKSARLDCFGKIANLWNTEKWECEAYKKSLECAQNLQKTANSDCTGKLGSYIYNAGESIKKYCKPDKPKAEEPKKTDKPATAPPKPAPTPAPKR